MRKYFLKIIKPLFWLRAGICDIVRTRFGYIGVKEYCLIRSGQWEAQAKKDYGPIKGAAVVADEEGWSQWENYEIERNLLIEMGDANKIAFEFGCGVGRVIRKIRNNFNRVDGADISLSVLKSARRFLDKDKAIFAGNKIDELNLQNKTRLFLTNGYDLKRISDNSYDLIFSEICLIHIIHPIVRLSLYNEFNRILKKDGKCVLMFFMAKKNFAAMNKITFNKGAFAFRNENEIRKEFSSSPFNIEKIIYTNPIENDRRGGAEAYSFVYLSSNKSYV